MTILCTAHNTAQAPTAYPMRSLGPERGDDGCPTSRVSYGELTGHSGLLGLKLGQFLPLATIQLEPRGESRSQIAPGRAVSGSWSCRWCLPSTPNGLINPLAMVAVCLHVQMTPVSRRLGEWSRAA